MRKGKKSQYYEVKKAKKEAVSFELIFERTDSGDANI